MTNQEIAKILGEIADFYEMKNIPFKPRAYQKAASSIAEADEQAAVIFKRDGEKGLQKIPGVGPGIADHIKQLLKTGKLPLYEQMKKRTPVNLGELRSIPGLGPKTARELYDKLGIRNLNDLEKALSAGKIAKLAGFGKKSEEKIAAGIKFRRANMSRYTLGEVELLVEKIGRALENSGYFQKIMFGGSYRRRQETVGDIDILCEAREAEKAMKFFVNLKDVAAVVEHGKTRSEIRLRGGIKVDLRLIEPKSWGAASIYFTGDKAHNIHLRKIAIEKGLKLSEYGLFKGQKTLPSSTEQDVYKALGMDFIQPEIRTDSGEIELALKNKLPKLLEYGSVIGDLQVQTNWSDGQASISEMAEAAIKLGKEYIAITDHTKSLTIARGLDEKRLVQQGKEIDKLNQKYKNSKFRILKGAEVNILKDGTLDINDETLAKFDVVGVSLHSHFNLPAKEMTARIVRALSNPNVDIFFHPTTRVLNRRPPVEFDFDAVLKAAKKYNVALEINAHPERLDLHDTLIRRAVDAGVKLVIDSDAHNTHELEYIKFGEAQARRGWAGKSDILNTLPVEDFLKKLRK